MARELERKIEIEEEFKRGKCYKLRIYLFLSAENLGALSKEVLTKELEEGNLLWPHAILAFLVTIVYCL